MRVLSAPTLDRYDATTTIEEDDAVQLLYVVGNNSVLARFRGGRRDTGGYGSYSADVPITPEKNVVPNCSGAQFKSAETGKPAQVIAVLVAPDDPQVGAGIPFLSTLSASGGIGQIGVLDRVLSDSDITNSNAELVLYSYNFAAGQIPVNGIVDLVLGGDLLHNNVAGDTFILRVKFGGVTIYQQTLTIEALLDAVRQPWELYVRIQHRGVANRQQMHGHFARPRAGSAAPTVGIGNTNNAGGAGIDGPIGSGVAPLTVDTALAAVLAVTGQWSASSPNNSFALRSGYLNLQ